MFVHEYLRLRNKNCYTIKSVTKKEAKIMGFKLVANWYRDNETRELTQEQIKKLIKYNSK